jgi:hypothetical protein
MQEGRLVSHEQLKVRRGWGRGAGEAYSSHVCPYASTGPSGRLSSIPDVDMIGGFAGSVWIGRCLQSALKEVSSRKSRRSLMSTALQSCSCQHCCGLKGEGVGATSSNDLSSHTS